MPSGIFSKRPGTPQHQRRREDAKASITKDPDVKLHLRRMQQSDWSALMSWIQTKDELVQWSGPWNFEFPLDERQLATFFLTETLDDKSSERSSSLSMKTPASPSGKSASAGSG